jgi:hypothetical protein
MGISPDRPANLVPSPLRAGFARWRRCQLGLVASYNRPGGNATSVVLDCFYDLLARGIAQPHAALKAN